MSILKSRSIPSEGFFLAFGGPGMYRKVNTTVVNKTLSRQITYTDLHIHLIGDHCFFQGEGSTYASSRKIWLKSLK